MKTKISIYILTAISLLVFISCKNETVQGPAGQDGLDGKDATVYFSEWFTPSDWFGTSGDWYFDASAPDLTKDIVESGVVLAYVWLAGDIYNGTSVRPLPAYALDANWSFLIHQYGSIEFTSDMFSKPLTTGNKFRFIAIPGNLETLKSASLKSISENELRKMTYQEVCKFFNISE
jgi:hypothetical protein